MSSQYRLVGLGNSELVSGLSELARQSNVLTAQLLAHLVELEDRMLHLELGFPSLFAYCVEGLGMSEGTAGRRVTAARVCRRFPEVFERVARGELHLCALCALAPYLTPENAVELFAACKGKTRRQVEELLAARFPRPDVREQIRRLPTRAQLPTTVEQVLPPCSAIAQPVSPQSAAEAPQILPNPALPTDVRATVFEARRRTRELEPLSADRFGVHFTADAELRELIERARALASHRLPNGELAGLVKLMAASFVKQEEKRRFGIGARPRRAKTQTVKTETAKTETETALSAQQGTPPGGVLLSPADIEPATRKTAAVAVGKRGRYVPVTVRRETYGRARGQCAFVSVAGRRCAARAFLEFDHVEPFARSGASDAANMRVFCKAHNLLHARNCFGAMHIAAKIAKKWQWRSVPCSHSTEPRSCCDDEGRVGAVGALTPYEVRCWIAIAHS